MKVLQISSATCGPCKMILPFARKLAEESGIPLEYIDIAAHPGIVEKYGVKSVPTFVKLSDEGVQEVVIGVNKDKIKQLFV